MWQYDSYVCVCVFLLYQKKMYPSSLDCAAHNFLRFICYYLLGLKFRFHSPVYQYIFATLKMENEKIEKKRKDEKQERERERDPADNSWCVVV